MKKFLRRILAVAVVVGALSEIAVAADILPVWLPKPPVPADNPQSAEKAELGRRLFYDTRLSADGSMACATCHQHARAFTDGRKVPVGVTGQAAPRNVPSLANVGYLPVLTWAHPRLTRLEAQLEIPLFGTAPVEMGMAGRERDLLRLFREDPDYRRRFLDIFGEISLAAMAKALAAFERTLISANAPYDRYLHDGEEDALSPAAKRGMALFFDDRLNCFQCHTGPHLAGAFSREGLPFAEIAFHNIGLYNIGGSGRYPADNQGLYEHTGKQEDRGRFRAPSLRNVAVTAPYMHDGSVATLAEVIDIYAAGGRAIAAGPLAGDGRAHPQKSSFIKGFTLTPSEKADLLAFLDSLTDQEFLENPAFGSPP